MFKGGEGWVENDEGGGGIKLELVESLKIGELEELGGGLVSQEEGEWVRVE